YATTLGENPNPPPLPRYFMVHRKGKEVERLGSPTTAWDFFINGESAGEVLTLVRAREDDPHHYDIYTTHNIKNLRSLVRMMPLAAGLEGTATQYSCMRVTAEGELVEREMNTTSIATAPYCIR